MAKNSIVKNGGATEQEVRRTQSVQDWEKIWMTIIGLIAFVVVVALLIIFVQSNDLINQFMTAWNNMGV